MQTNLDAYMHTHTHTHTVAPKPLFPGQSTRAYVHTYIHNTHAYTHTHTVAPTPMFTLPSQCLSGSVRNRASEFGTQIPSTSSPSSSGAAQQLQQASSPSASSKRKPDTLNAVNPDSESTTSLSLSVLKRKFQQREMAVNQTSRPMSSLSLLKRKIQQRHTRAPSQQATSESSHLRADWSKVSTTHAEFETYREDQQEILLEEVAGEVHVYVYMQAYMYKYE